MEGFPQIKKESKETEKFYVMYSGGSETGPSIDGPYTKEEAEDMHEFGKNSTGGPAVVGVLTAEEAEEYLVKGGYKNHSDLGVPEDEE